VLERFVEGVVFFVELVVIIRVDDEFFRVVLDIFAVADEVRWVDEIRLVDEVVGGLVVVVLRRVVVEWRLVDVVGRLVDVERRLVVVKRRLVVAV
jgi:hypothetical protein